MPDIIKLLPDSVANQIAAGEVIQRPASVVKELVENSVDAGADSIDVVIKDSGKTLIQIIDNGTGMSTTDARLAFERHATSKITKATDLFSINTKGFRGEALASIAAVAMVELKTRKDGEDVGTLLVINGSKVETQEMCSCPKGSCFSVKNLFFNIPARRKFLKSDNTEFRHIVIEFQKIALAHPGIKFTLKHNETDIYNLFPCNLRQRIVSVFGKQINQDLINIEAETTLVSIKGFIGKPECAKRSYGEQFFFANNRFMKHPYFHKAVTEAYQKLLPSDVFPSYFIYLTADPASIDINIHPTKTEIKFEEEQAIWQIIMAATREALGRFNISPAIDFDSDTQIDFPLINKCDTLPKPPEIKIDTSYNPFDGDTASLRRDRHIRQFESDVPENWEKLYSGIFETDRDVIGNDDFTVPPQQRILQIKNKYILVPVKSGLMIIDQKKAHERILFERCLNGLKADRLPSQKSLFPVTVEINPADFLILKEADEVLKKLGFSLVFTDNNKITVNGYPAIIESLNPVDTLETLAEEFKTTNIDNLTSAKEQLSAAIASASAIPYGKELSMKEMGGIIDDLFACSEPNYSPKGKPVINIVNIDEIDKKF